MDAKKNAQKGGRFLRKPRAPKPRPPSSPLPISSDILHAGNPQYAFYPANNQNEFETPTHSVSPPPPTETQSRPHSHLFDRSRLSTRKTPQRGSMQQQEDKYMLDPAFRQKTNLGTYVEGNSLVKPYRPRGPAPLPCRPPRHNYPPIMSLLDEDDLRYYEPPIFTLQDFTLSLSEKENVPLEKVQSAVYSRHTYKKLQALLAERCMPRYPKLKTVQLQLPDEAACTSQRIPHQQLLLEMSALVKEHMSSAINTDMKSVIRPLPRFSPDYKPDGTNPHTEILLYEDTSEARRKKLAQLRQDTEIPSHDSFFHAPVRHFQDSRRSHSPFVTADEAFISPSELAVLDSIMSGGSALSLKANFISQLPDIDPLTGTITYLNLSFNDFRFIPVEVFDIHQLTVLKLRNNPIKDISPDIGRLKNLKTLVISFCLISVLPMELFELTSLEQLDVAYNKITKIPNDIRALENLRELNLEGNQLPALPAGAMTLSRLKYLRIRNNYMHPLFWRENTPNYPQRLMDISALVVKQHNIDHYYNNLPDHIMSFLQQHSDCDICHGPLYGSGSCTICPVSKIFGIKNVPFLFHCCSENCMTLLKGNSKKVINMLYGIAK